MRLKRDKQLWELLKLNTDLRYEHEAALERIFALHCPTDSGNCISCTVISNQEFTYPCPTINAARGDV